MTKKIAAINDISGMGRCSLSAALPIISALKVQCCPFPTSVLSNQTEYPDYTLRDLTADMRGYYMMWEKLGFEFDTIFTGFLGNKSQVDVVEEFIKRNGDSLVVVDPVMADSGEMYPCFTKDYVNDIKRLVCLADVITPNLTEALLLTGRPIDYSPADLSECIDIARDLSALGPKRVIITGVIEDEYVFNICYDSKFDRHELVSSEYLKKSYSGTGDIFTSIVSALLTRGEDFFKTVHFASRFIYRTIEYTSRTDTDRNDGVCFEYFMKMLTEV